MSLLAAVFAIAKYTRELDSSTVFFLPFVIGIVCLVAGLTISSILIRILINESKIQLNMFRIVREIEKIFRFPPTAFRGRWKIMNQENRYFVNLNKILNSTEISCFLSPSRSFSC